MFLERNTHGMKKVCRTC